MRKYVIIYLLVFACGLFYLTLHSIVTLDEVMLLDPCLNFMKGHYSSKIWFAPGSELAFMSYLPANFLFRIFFLYVFPHQLFFYRLPYILLFIGSGFLLYSIVQKKYQQPLWSIITTIFFINDKGLWDASLSGRTEIIQVFLILVYFYFALKNSKFITPIVKGIVIGLILLTHPPAWIIAAVLGWFTIDLKNLRTTLISWIPIIVIVGFFVISIRFQIPNLLTQLFLEGSLSSPSHSFGYRISHFSDRFLPYPYLMQPWVILLLILCAYFWINFRIKKSDWEQKIGIVFFTYSLFLLFTSENYSRYNPPLLVCAYMFLPFILKYISDKIRRSIPSYFYLITIVLVSIPFVLRVYRAKKNHELNDSRLAITQLSRAIANQSKEQLLIIGEPIGYFIASENTGADYTPLYTKHKFNNRIYDREILLSYQVYPETQYKLLSKVDSLNNESGTYQGLKCYERISTSASAQDK